MNPETLCLKIKRNNVTLYASIDSRDTVLSLKNRIAAMQNIAPENQRLFFEAQVLDDTRTLREHKVDRDQTLYLSLRKEDGEWEDLSVVKSSLTKA